MLFSKNNIRKNYVPPEYKPRHRTNRFYSGSWYGPEYKRVIPISNTYLNDRVIYTNDLVQPVIHKTIIKKQKDYTTELIILVGIVSLLWFKFSK